MGILFAILDLLARIVVISAAAGVIGMIIGFLITHGAIASILGIAILVMLALWWLGRSS